MATANQQRLTWPHVANLMLALWLIGSAPALGGASLALMVSDIGSGIVLAACSLLALRRESAAWVACGVGLWVFGLVSIQRARFSRSEIGTSRSRMRLARCPRTSRVLQ